MRIKIQLATCAFTGLMFVVANCADTDREVGSFNNLESAEGALDDGYNTLLYSKDFNTINDDDLNAQDYSVLG